MKSANRYLRSFWSTSVIFHYAAFNLMQLGLPGLFQTNVFTFADSNLLQLCFPALFLILCTGASLYAPFTGPKKLGNSRAQPPPPRNVYVPIQNIMHGAVWITGA
jgi:hypothetical protein